ncbi:MAG: Uma2 family endonuclease [Chloroflexota bacterium]
MHTDEIPLMDMQQTRYTVADYLTIAALPENAHKRLELIDGLIVDMPPSSKRNTIIAMTIGRLIGNYVAENNLGFVTGADGGFKITEENTFQPDAAYISKERMPDLDGVVFEVAPDLAVEVISPGETAAHVNTKTRRYLEAGTKGVWTVYPETQTVDVNTRSADGHIVTMHIDGEGTLTGGEALPGFAITLAQIFV